jgi:hypothetical protein
MPPPVMIPPVVKVMVRGARLTMAFAGATTLAAMLVVSVARMRPEDSNHSIDTRTVSCLLEIYLKSPLCQAEK